MVKIGGCLFSHLAFSWRSPRFEVPFDRYCSCALISPSPCWISTVLVYSANSALGCNIPEINRVSSTKSLAFNCGLVMVTFFVFSPIGSSTFSYLPNDFSIREGLSNVLFYLLRDYLYYRSWYSVAICAVDKTSKALFFDLKSYIHP